MIVGGFSIAFASGWHFALILCTYQPILFFLVFGIRRIVKSSMIEKFKQGSILGSRTEETLSALKLVVSFANEKKHIDSYKKVAKKTMKLGQFSAVVTGAYGGLFFGSAIGFSVFSWTLGGILIMKQYINPTTGTYYNVADIITVYQAELYGLMTFASMGAHQQIEQHINKPMNRSTHQPINQPIHK